MAPARVCSEEREWTVGRCHRLLRPVTSRLGILRSRGFIATQNLPEKPKKDPVTIGANINEDDPDWTDQTKKCGRKKRRQYGRRREGSPKPSHQARTTANLRPGEIPIATPLLSRTSHFTVEGSPNTPMSFCQLSKLAESRSRSLEHQSIMAGLRQALRTVFEQTYPEPSKSLDITRVSSAKSIPKKGPRSLFETCLRMIPAYIATEEQFHKEDNPDHREDISSRVYDDLGSLPAIWGRRSSSLRTVLRSQALFLFHQAICEGLMDGKDVIALSAMLLRGAKVSRQILTFEEVNYLHQAWLTRECRIPYPKAASDHIADVGNHHSQLISAAYSMTRVERTFEAGCNILQQLIASQKLPVQWLVTRRMGGLLAHALKAVVSPVEDSFFASRLLSTAILQCCGLHLPPNLAVKDLSTQIPGGKGTPNHSMDTGLSNVFETALDLTVQSLAVPLFTIAYTSGQDVNPENPAYRLLQDVITDMVLALQNGISETSRSFLSNRRIFGFLFIGLFLNLAQGVNRNRSMFDLTEDIVNVMDNLIPQIERVPELLRIMAHYCSRATRKPQETHLKELQQHLLSLLSIPNMPQRVSKRFSIACHKISQELSSGEVPDETRVDPAPRPEARSSDDKICAQKGYRWEEGIEEWVMDSMNAIVLGSTSGLRKPGAPAIAIDPEQAEDLKSSSTQQRDGDDGNGFLGPLENTHGLCGSPSQMSHSGADLFDEYSASEAESAGSTHMFRKRSSIISCDLRGQKRKMRTWHTIPLLAPDPPANCQPNVSTLDAPESTAIDNRSNRVDEWPRRRSEAIRSRIAHIRRPLSNCPVNQVGKRRRCLELDKGFVGMEESLSDGFNSVPAIKRRRTCVEKTRSLTVSDLAMARADQDESDDELSFL